MRVHASRERAVTRRWRLRDATDALPRRRDAVDAVVERPRRAAQVKISDLEGALQHFINQSFENITSIENSLSLLSTFQAILQRETLKSDLDSKLNVIFQNYGIELEQVQQLYEKQKHDPPIPRNLPPVAGNITWSRHLLKRIEGPMKQFELNQNVSPPDTAKTGAKRYWVSG